MKILAEYLEQVFSLIPNYLFSVSNNNIFKRTGFLKMFKEKLLFMYLNI